MNGKMIIQKRRRYNLMNSSQLEMIRWGNAKNPTHHLFEQPQAYVSLGIESFDLMKNWMNDIEIHVQANRFGNVENIGRNTWGAAWI